MGPECVSAVSNTLPPRDLLALAETNSANCSAVKPLLDAQWTALRDEALVLSGQIRIVRQDKALLRKHLCRVFYGEWTDTDDKLDVISERETAALWTELPAAFKARVVPGSFSLSLEDDIRHVDIFYKMRAGGFDLNIEQHFHMFANPGHEYNYVCVSRDGQRVVYVDDDLKDVTAVGDARNYGIGALLHCAYHLTFDKDPEDPDKALWVRFAKRRAADAAEWA